MGDGHRARPPRAADDASLRGGLDCASSTQDGRIAGYVGVDEIRERFGKWIIDEHLPPPGTPTQPVDAGFMANAWIRLKHPDYDTCRSMLDVVGQTVKVIAR